jgi:hypothetical protein
MYGNNTKKSKFHFGEIKKRLNFENPSYHSVLLSSCLRAKNLNIKIHGIVIFPTVLYGCETWSLTLREEHRLCVFQYWALKNIFWPEVDEAIKRLEKTA